MALKHHFKHTIAILMLLCMVLTLLPVQTMAAGAEWTVSSNTRIHWVKTADSVSDDTALKAQVQLFSQELMAKGITKSTLAINYGPLSSAGTNDIILYLDSSLSIGEQAYEIEVGNAVKISASDADGLFYGCRYVLQHLITGDGLTVGQTYGDSPLVLERAVMLDNGRKYYTKDWIINLIREMSWYNMNALVLHFSEDMGIRLEHPYKEYSWLIGSDDALSSQNGNTQAYFKNGEYNDGSTPYAVNDVDAGKYLTIPELKEIVAAAKLYHVEIIPSFDSPGHMTYAIEKYKEKYGVDIGAWIYSNGVKSQPTDNNPAGTSYSIDLSNQTAIDFARDVVKGYAELFYSLGCTKFDMGGDELLGSNSRWASSLPTWATYAQKETGNSAATAYDAFILYMNDLAAMLYGLGYESVRMWNDMLYLTNYATQTVELDNRIEVNYWTNKTNNSKNSVNTYLNKGHNVYNYYNDFNYFVLKPNGIYPLCSSDLIYQYWTPYVFQANYTQTNTGYVYESIAVEVTDQTKKAKIKGSAFCIWSDAPDFYTEGEVLTLSLDRIRAHAVKAWGVSTVDLTAFNKTLTTLGQCPGKSGSYGSVALPSAPAVTVLVDTTQLQVAINEAKNVDSTIYTDASYQAYADAIKAGESLVNSSTATQTQVNEALANIEAAKEALTYADGYCAVLSAYFCTNRVRSGGTAVLRVVTTVETTDFTLKDVNGTVITDFDVVRIPDEVCEDGIVSYLKFTVNGTGKFIYTVIANDSAQKTVPLTQWSPAQ